MSGAVAAPRDHARLGLAAGFAVSLLVHAGAAWWLGAVPPARSRAMSVDPGPLDDAQEPDPLRLGLDLPENASIAWLGVLSDPVEAKAPESEVEQAALSPAPGDEPAPDPATPTRPTETPSELPPAEPSEPTVEPVAPEPSPPDAGPPLPFPLPTEPGTPEAPAPSEAAAPADAAEMGPPAPTEADRRPAVEPATEPAPPAPPAPATPRPEPTPDGTPGEVDERAADAAMRRTARELPIDRLGRPLQASGDLRLNTVRPTWSLQVRNAYSPRRNPFVEILFGADGKVKLARFVRMPDGSRGSGYEEVDQPLLNAVYRWTAQGEAIEDLRGTDGTHRVVMRFLLVPSVPGSSQEEPEE